jgi:selenocysteine lyase/cysteine desulfurase
VSFTHAEHSPQQLAAGLAAAHVYCWPGNSYAVALTSALGLEPDGVLRLGMLHYNTGEEVRYVLAQLRRLLTGSLA